MEHWIDKAVAKSKTAGRTSFNCASRRKPEVTLEFENEVI